MIGGRNKDDGFGKCVRLRREVKQLSNNNNTITNNISASPITTIKQFEESMMILRITEPTYLKFREHSQMYHNVSSYEDILNELLDFYAKHHEKKYFA
jgi:hypothetical protein